MTNIHRAKIFNDSTGGINNAWRLAKYNEEAVQQAIDKDKSIGKREAKAIHALLKGRV